MVVSVAGGDRVAKESGGSRRDQYGEERKKRQDREPILTPTVQTHSEVSAHPSSGSVTVAASGKEMEADVQRKMKMWGVIEGFRDG